MVKFPIIILIYMLLQLGWINSNTGRIQGVYHYVIHHWKDGIFSILQMYVEL